MRRMKCSIHDVGRSIPFGFFGFMSGWLGGFIFLSSDRA